MTTGYTLSFTPLIPWLWLALLGGLLLALTLVMQLRRAPGGLLRLLSGGLLLLLLANPSFVTERREPIPDVAVVVVDRSPSQHLSTRPEDTALARRTLEKSLAHQPNLDVRWVESDPGGDETRLLGLLDRAFADVPEKRRAGAILITDGAIHDVPKEPRHYGPVHALLTGAPDETDRRLRLLAVPAYGLVGQTLTAKIRVEDSRARPDDSATLILRADDGTTRHQTVPVGRDSEVQFPLGHAGSNVLGLEVEPREDEISTANNRAALIANGVRDRLRVLVISGFPHNGERVWRNLLKSDPSVDLVHFTILRTPGQDFGLHNDLSLIPFPTEELFNIKLPSFDLVIIDRYRDRNLLEPQHLANLARYVENGGALLDATGTDLADPGGGLPATALADLLPAADILGTHDGAFIPTVTATGLRHPVTQNLPGLKPDGTGNWGPWLHSAEVTPRPESQVLMQGAGGAPLLLLARIGKGRSAEITSEESWLWARGYQGGGPHVELLRPLIHWLMKEPELEEERLTLTAVGNTLEIQRHSLTPLDGKATLTRPDGKPEEISLTADRKTGAARATIEAGNPGVYRVESGGLSALAIAGRPDAPELMEARATTERLAPLAKASGGGLFWTREGLPEIRRTTAHTAHGRGWLGLRENGDYTTTGLRVQPLLPAALAALLFVILAYQGWRRESR